MELLSSFLDKMASLQGQASSDDRPNSFFSDPDSHEYHMAMIWDHAAHNEVHLPVVLKEAKGAYLWDVKGNKYIDFMACHSAVNQGHCHPKILEAINEQGKHLTLTSSICNHNVLGPVAKKLTDIFKYDKILFRNSGSEAVDTCVLTARRWGYKKKNIPYGKATVLFAEHCYWGMILSARSGSTDEERRELSEPLATEALCFDFVGFDNTELLEAKLKSNPNICAYIFEPIQGHAGNIYPTPGYYKKVRELCTKYNVLMVTDECQTGLGRVGKLLACDWEDVRPDMIALGKSLGAGYMPVSAVLANNDIMDVWPPPTSHLSTYASNPIACVVAAAAVDVIFEDNLIENSERLGKIVTEELEKYDYPFIVKKNIGKGLFASLEFKDLKGCWAVCINMMKKGILVRPEAGAHLKVNPPLCISEEDLRYGLQVLKESLDDYNKKGLLGVIV